MPYFSSRDSQYKEPFGAVPCGETIRFFVDTAAEEAFCACFLEVTDDFSRRVTKTALTPCDGGFSALWQAPQTPTLLWYRFLLVDSDGAELSLGKGGLHDETPWQQTVYVPPTVDRGWFGRGITYQIFPDRFCRTALPHSHWSGERYVHEDWDDTPRYLPDADGEIRNNDFFGGTLPGIAEKLDYLASLGVTTLYLNPIFLSDSNHRYNTADYETIDPMLGSEADFRQLCEQAAAYGIRILLDGVFNHTGSNSRYFNAFGVFPDVGAAQSPSSPYADWFCFHPWPDSYDAWWGIRTLPAVNENAPSYRDYIIRGANSVIRRWLRCGAAGWRLDVADELPDDFIAELRGAMTEENPNSFLLGEVWEDGSHKIAYDKRRRYLLGTETDGLMNYPFRTALIDYLRGGDAACFRETMETLRENYPPFAFYGAMNMLGTHDTPRILTALGIDELPAEKSDRAAYRLPPALRQRAVMRLQLGSLIQYAFPGSPTVYYGDEAGLEGLEDPFCRGTYPWGREDAALITHYRLLGRLRREHSALQEGSFSFLAARGSLLAFRRADDAEALIVCTNAGDIPAGFSFPGSGLYRDLLSGQTFFPFNGTVSVSLPPVSGMLLIKA